jgi:hypothetical protein
VPALAGQRLCLLYRFLTLECELIKSKSHEITP